MANLHEIVAWQEAIVGGTNLEEGCELPAQPIARNSGADPAGKCVGDSIVAGLFRREVRDAKPVMPSTNRFGPKALMRGPITDSSY